MTNSMFDTQSFFSSLSIPSTADVIFVADMFANDYQGGAELTTEAILGFSPFEVFRLHSKDVNMKLLEEGVDKYWIFGNFASLKGELIPSIVANLKYSIVEYDYKYCRYRSTEKHEAAEGNPCDCHNNDNGKIVSAFFYGAQSLHWMSEAQRNHYFKIFPFLEQKDNFILSSVFSHETLGLLTKLREETEERKGWVVLDSPSWVKGAEAAKSWCEENDKEYEAVWNLPYPELLKKLSKAEGLVYLPSGKDTCPRMVIEAKLLGCELILNENVQHKNEVWFDTDDLFDTQSYLYTSGQIFWKTISEKMNFKPTVSGYTTTYNCIEQKYPFKQSILSMVGFCDEVIVLDGGSNDGTLDELRKLEYEHEEIKVFVNEVDWSQKRFAVQDGLQKSRARSKCTSAFCWQQDSDEIVHEQDYEKIKDLVKNFPANTSLIALPVIEYWGGPNKVRMDILPWKWRLSKNSPDITHGIPKEFRKIDDDGNLYAAPGTDGCDYISKSTNEIVPCVSFYTADVHNARLQAVHNNSEKARVAYENWFNNVVNSLPGVHHYSWYDLERKIKTYRDYWSSHWQSLYDITQEDTAENNMFFDKAWSDVSDEEIFELSKKLASEMNGWVFHSKIDFDSPTPPLNTTKTHPKIMHGYISSRYKEAFNESVIEAANDLFKIKNDSDWAQVRNEDLYEIVEKEYNFGKRRVFELRSRSEDYVNLQQSRGITIDFNDSVEDIVARTVSRLSVAPADMLRINELDSLLKREDVKFNSLAELGFRVPKLLDYYEKRGMRAAGFDVARISVEISKALGFEVSVFNFNDCHEKDVDLKDFDVVVSYHMLEHLTDPLAAIEKIYEGMKPGAYFHVEVPIEPDGPHLRFGHLFPFHLGDLGSMLKEVGFEIVNSSNKTHPGGSHIVRHLAKR